MKPHRIHIVRHGESVGNVDRSIYSHTPDWKVELTQKGRDQAFSAGTELMQQLRWYSCTGLLGVYESPYRRTKATTDGILSALTPEIGVERRREDPRLREQEWGGPMNFDPRGWKAIEEERDAHGSFYYRFSHGESGGDVYDRMSGFLDTLYRDFENPSFPEDVLIVTHGYALRVLLMRWLHYTVDEFHTMANPANCARFTLELDKTDHYQLITPFPRYETGEHDGNVVPPQR